MNNQRTQIAAIMTVMISAAISGAETAVAPANPLPPPALNTKPITSHQRHFTVVGMPSGLALELAIWAESVRERLSNWVGKPIPGDHTYPIIIEAVARTNEPYGRVIPAQLINDDGHLRQAITLINQENMDQEDLLEALTGLLLNRWVHVRQSSGDRRLRPGSMPEWLTVAVAQNLYPELKERNIRLIENAEAKQDHAPASSIVFNTRFPPGRWKEKAHAGLVGAWLSEALSPPVLIDEAAAILATGKTLDLPAMTTILGLPDDRAFDMSWDIWMARQSRRIVPGTVSSDYRNAARILEMRQEDIGLIYPGTLPDGKLTPEQLIENRDRPWVRDVCRGIAWRLQQAGIGKTFELVEAIRMFIDFFIQLPPPEKGESRSLASDRALNQIWSEANENWLRFVEKEETRKAYVDSIDNSPREFPSIDADAISTFMDQWEKERDREP